MTKFSCPNCGERCAGVEPEAGRAIRCARCGAEFAMVRPPQGRAADSGKPHGRRVTAGWAGLIFSLASLGLIGAAVLIGHLFGPPPQRNLPLEQPAEAASFIFLIVCVAFGALGVLSAVAGLIFSIVGLSPHCSSRWAAVFGTILSLAILSYILFSSLPVVYE